MKTPWILAVLILAALALVWPGPASAQESSVSAEGKEIDSDPDPDTDADENEAQGDLEALRALVQRQQALLEAQAGRLEEQQGQLDDQAAQIAEQQKLMEEQAKAIHELMARLDSVDTSDDELSEAELALLERIEQLEREDTSAEDRSSEVAVAGDFPGSIKIPGTSMAFRVGGFTATNIVLNSVELKSEDRFVTSEIPVPARAGASIQDFNVSVRRTRLNFDWRMDSTVGQFRSFIEGDFLGDGTTFRLRHAYGQYQDLTLGQTWSTFADPLNDPEEIDLEGINGQILVRQPLARFKWRPKRGFERAVGLENPAPDVTGGTGLTQIPDLVYRMSRDREDRSLRFAGIVRLIRAEPGDSIKDGTGESDQAMGFGVSASGRFPARFWGDTDLVMYQVNVGRGLGRYITDLAAEGGQDAAFHPETGDLKALGVFAGFLSYRHNWPLEWRDVRSLRSTLTLGWVNVRNRDFQPDEAYNKTYRLGLTTLWSPIPRLDLGLEYLWGRRVNKDGKAGTANQIQFATYFRF